MNTNMEKITPARAQTIHSDILVPLLFALIISTPISIFVAILGIVGGVEKFWILTIILWISITIIVFVIYSKLIRDTWYIFESHYETPQYIPQPTLTEYEERIVGLKPYNYKAQRKQAQEKTELVKFAEICAERGTAIRNFDGISPKKWAELRDKLIESGYAEWNVPGSNTQGWKLIAKPSEIEENIVDLGRKLTPIDGKPFFVK